LLRQRKNELPPLAQVKSETKPSPPPQSRKDIIEQQIQKAQSDLQFLQDEYPTKSLQEQQDALKRLRAIYGAGAKSNPIHIQKAIRDKLQDLNDELQTI
jgi:small-conductance mechanosensitive channel